MKIHGIQGDLLNTLLAMGANWHPDEFAALLKEENGVITELELLPGTIGGRGHTTMHLDMMPLDTHLAGSVHSHPNGLLHPSSADLAFFPRAGRYHLIVGYPYRYQDWRCFTASGDEVILEVIE